MRSVIGSSDGARPATPQPGILLRLLRDAGEYTLHGERHVAATAGRGELAGEGELGRDAFNGRMLDFVHEALDLFLVYDRVAHGSRSSSWR
jgi:hypothetical protein